MTLSEITDKLQIHCHNGISNLNVSEIIHECNVGENITTTMTFEKEIYDIKVNKIDDKNVSLTFVMN